MNPSIQSHNNTTATGQLQNYLVPRDTAVGIVPNLFFRFGQLGLLTYEQYKFLSDASIEKFRKKCKFRYT